MKTAAALRGLALMAGGATIGLALLAVAPGISTAQAEGKDGAPTAVENAAEGEDAPPSRWATPRYPGARIFIDAAGNVFIDDEPATADLLHEAFASLTRYNGVVWYNRENPSREPSGKVAEAVDQVMRILTGYTLSVELFEAGFPDPDTHWLSLDNPPPRYKPASPAPDAKQGEG